MPSEDKNSRNYSSYRPDGLPDSWDLNAPSSLDFARDIWTALEPSSKSRFDTIDRHILRTSLESIYRRKTGLDPEVNPNKYEQFITNVVTPQGFSEKVSNHWTGFLCRRIVPANLSILDHSKHSNGDKNDSHLAVMSRAILLLRLASGTTAELFEVAGYTADEIAFWWNAVGNSRGLWDGVREAESLVDLWADIEPVLQEIETFQASSSPTEQTLHRTGSELGHLLAGLASCERVAVWGLVPN